MTTDLFDWKRCSLLEKPSESCAQQGCICQISLGGVEVLAIEVDDRANA